MKIMELLEWGNNKLKEHQEADQVSGTLDSPMLDAELLLAATLEQPKPYLFSHLNHDVPEKKAEVFRKMIKRRAKNEPLSYITGRKDFFGRTFNINRFVLIPRPATETLVEEVIEIEKKLDGETWFSDIGVGSGAIAVSLAAETGKPVIASDINERALILAKQNAKQLSVNELMEFKSGPGLDPLTKILTRINSEDPRLLPDNLIITANLPYLTTEQMENVQPEVREWEPTEALVAGADGLDEYWKLFKELARSEALLPKTTYVVIEIDPNQSEAIISLIQHYFAGAQPKIKKDLSGHDRVVLTKIK